MDLSKIYFDSNGKKGNILQIVALEPEWAAKRIQEGEKAIARITELEAALTAAQERNVALQSEHLDHVNALNEQLAAAQERETALNGDLHYALELAIAYAHSEKDKEWAEKRIEELMPPEQEVKNEKA